MLLGKRLNNSILPLPPPNPRIINSKIKKPLADIVLKATQKDPDARFQGCLAFLKAIESYERGRNWKIWGLSLSIILAAGIWYFVQNLKAVRSLATLATDNYALLCREAETLKRKESGLRIAAESGDAEMVEAFSKHVSDHNANIEKFLGDYAGAFRELSKFRGSTAHKVFSEREQIDEAARARYEQTDELERAKFWQLTGDDYEQFRTTGQNPAKGTMLGKCPP
jgi:DNA-directed RNA polymerase specialized sigma subunit